MTPDPYAWRPARYDDMPAVQALSAALAAAEGESLVPTLEDVQREFDDPWSIPATDTRVALAADGAVVAFARIIANPEPDGESRAHLIDDLHPAHRGQGLEDAMLDWLEARGADRLWSIGAAHPGQWRKILRLAAWDTSHDNIARYEARGFRPVRYFYRMQRDLRQPIPDRPVPPGLVLRTYGADIDEGMRQAHEEAFNDHWSHEPISASDWQQFVIQRSTFRADLTLALLDGPEVAAFSINRADPAEAQRLGFAAGWIGSLGTRRAWRKRGLASALLVESMHAFRAAGLDYALLAVDAANPTGALSLYEELGFETYKRRIAFDKEVYD